MCRSNCMQFPCYAFMLGLCHFVILIYVTIDKFSYDINVTKIALILYLYNPWTKLFSYAFGYNSKLFRLIRLCIRYNICGPSERLLEKIIYMGPHILLGVQLILYSFTQNNSGLINFK